MVTVNAASSVRKDGVGIQNEMVACQTSSAGEMNTAAPPLRVHVVSWDDDADPSVM